MAHDTGSWSRAFMASTGMSISQTGDGQRATSPEWHEAINPDLDRLRLIELATSRSTAIREAIAGRSDCPLGVLATLAHDHRPSVRTEVAANPAIPRAIAELLVKDRDASVLKAIARNESTPHDVVLILSTHKKEDVRRVASKRVDAEALTDTPSRPATQGPSTLPGRTQMTLAPRPDVGARGTSVPPPSSPMGMFLPVTS